MNKLKLPELDWKRINSLIDMAFKEDVKTGDATSTSVISKDVIIEARLVSREKSICAGLDIAVAVFQKTDNSISWQSCVADGDTLYPGTILAVMKGNACSILTAERTALNFLQHLCGIATETSRYVKALGKSKTKILDTRKTTPAWRNLEKYAVAAGGGTNHRFGLYDRIMIKDNHRALAGLEGSGGIERSVKRARKAFPNLEIEVEADNLDEVREAIKARADYILLDNIGQ